MKRCSLMRLNRTQYANYTVKIVIRDLGTGKEKIISGEQISKGVNP